MSGGAQWGIPYKIGFQNVKYAPRFCEETAAREF